MPAGSSYKERIITTKSEFIEKIENGSDIVFTVAVKSYAIFTWTDKGIAIGEQNKDNLSYFSSAEDLINGFSIDHTPLALLIDQIKITDYS